ncbi:MULTISPECIES: response regulator transcription factor [Subtercola]|uniref:DNA-binding response regulator n=1 Tax=Subtercola vilae TaxID=2056433 RepID=A0A4T2CBQ0_9MICO|nr:MULTISPECIES: response regulator transcription factor [Subtercola]MEA9984304.1 response regulator transcription factor [Subtercola sp. RTI3]TIH40126.1 DNA-binding response regulator [Subtercola vilae]
MRILVVDDERAFARVLATGLTAEGFVVDTVYDGRTGYLMAATGAYSAIVLDLMLPHLSGFAVCARLRADGVMTPVIVLTAKNGEFDEVEALESGADDYLRKPFSYPVLVARIRSLLRRPTSISDSVVTIGDLVIDAARRRVQRGATLIELSGREWNILETLARAAGTVVSKETLLVEVWPNEADDVNLVEARVSVLRRKIDVPFGRRSLETVRGAGYRLVDDRPTPDSRAEVHT